MHVYDDHFAELSGGDTERGEEKLRLKSGQKMTVVTKGGVVYLIPEKPLDAFKGFLKGMDSSNIREGESLL